MRAHRCVLTHFSQRYPKLPNLPKDVSSRVLVACDLMSVTLGQLAWAPAAVLPVLRCLFSPDDDAAEAAAEAAADKAVDASADGAASVEGNG
jgi:ribonuclease Z